MGVSPLLETSQFPKKAFGENFPHGLFITHILGDPLRRTYFPSFNLSLWKGSVLGPLSFKFRHTCFLRVSGSKGLAPTDSMRVRDTLGKFRDWDPHLLKHGVGSHHPQEVVRGRVQTVQSRSKIGGPQVTIVFGKPRVRSVPPGM